MRRDQTEETEASYRAYELDKSDTVVDFTVISAASEEAALAHMQRIAAGRVMELWDRGRLIGRVDPSVDDGVLSARDVTIMGTFGTKS